jgi:hypothetical protein
MDIRDLTDLKLMYRCYIDKGAIDKQKLIAILREGNPLKNYNLTYAELAPFIADCLDDKVLYITKHNEKIMGIFECVCLAHQIGKNIHAKKKAPRESAIRGFAEKKGWSERHVRTAIKKDMSKENFEWHIAMQIFWLTEDEKD